MFHVKHSGSISLNQGILLPYTKLPENHVEDILDIHPAQQPSQANAPPPGVPRRPVPRPFPTDIDAAPQRSCGLRNKFPLPRPADQPPSLRAKIVLREANQGRDQLRQPVTPAGRNPELGRCRRPWPIGQCRRPAGVEIDLVAHQPNRRRPVVLDRRAGACRPATTPDPPQPPAPAPGARLPAPPDRRSRECRRCRSPSPDSRRDRAAPR